jgi:hypothetical protein
VLPVFGLVPVAALVPSVLVSKPPTTPVLAVAVAPVLSVAETAVPTGPGPTPQSGRGQGRSHGATLAATRAPVLVRLVRGGPRPVLLQRVLAL